MIEKITEQTDFRGVVTYTAWLGNGASAGRTREEAVHARLLAEARSRQHIWRTSGVVPWRSAARAGRTTTDTPTAVERARRRLESDEHYRLADAARDAGGEITSKDGRDLWLPVPGTWHADDGNAEIEIPGAADGEAAASEYVDDGDWGDRTETSWVSVRAWREAYDEWGVAVDADEEWHTVEIEAVEPECADGEEHDWQSPLEVVGGCAENPGVWGHGGGVIITEVCSHCGAYQVTDTWAQNWETGEQGLHSVEYRDADDDSSTWVESLRDGDEAEEEE